MDENVVKDIGNNLPDMEKIKPDKIPVEDMKAGAPQAPTASTPQITSNDVPEKTGTSNNDVLDPEEQKEENKSNTPKKDNENNNSEKDKENEKKNDNSNDGKQSEDVLDPEAEKEKEKEEKKKKDDKDDKDKDKDKNKDENSDKGNESQENPEVKDSNGNDVNNGKSDLKTDTANGKDATPKNTSADAPKGNTSGNVEVTGNTPPSSTPTTSAPTTTGAESTIAQSGTVGTNVAEASTAGSSAATGSTTAATTGSTAAATGGTAAATTGGTAAAAGGTAAGGAAAGGAAAGGAAAGGAAAGGAAAGGAAGGAAAAGGIAAGGWIVILVILVIIIIIGIIAFLVNMPGLMVGKLKQFAQNVLDEVESWFLTEADAFINDKDVTNLAQYLVDMNYDLIGYGFVRAEDHSSSTSIKTIVELAEEGYTLNSSGKYVDSSGNLYTGQYYDSSGKVIDNDTTYGENDRIKDKYGIEYWVNDGTLNGTNHTAGQIAEINDRDTALLNSNANGNDELLRAYLMSDYRISVLRNDDDDFLRTIGQFFDTVFGGSTNSWTKGLIKVYRKTEENGLESLDKFTDGITTVWWNDISINNNMLSIRNGYFNQPMEFELNGWTGRYGLSLEFLLSLHLSTMAPDLVYAMLQSFDTEIQVYAEHIKDAEVETKYVDYKSGKDVDVEWVNEVLAANGVDFFFVSTKDLTDWYNSLVLSKKNCQYLLNGLEGDQRLTSPPNCTYIYQTDLVEKATDGSTSFLFFDTSSNPFNDYGFENNSIVEYILEIEEDYDNYKYYNDSGKSTNFDIGHCVIDVSNKEDYVDNIEKTYFSDSTLSAYGYDANNLDVNETKVIQEYSTKGRKVRTDKTKEGDWTAGDNAQQNHYDLKLVQTTKEWTADFTDNTGTFVEDQWFSLVSYKVILVRTGYDLYDLGTDGKWKHLGYTDAEMVDHVYLWEFVIRDKTMNELEADGALGEDGTVDPNRTMCSSVSDNKKCCSNCKKYVSYVVRALAEIADDDYSYFQPYIARVVGSWFRDTYFIIPEEADQGLIDYYGSEDNVPISAYGTEGKYLKVDEEYLGTSGEYWTAYEMKKDADGNETSEYQLYYLEHNGKTSTIKMEDWLSDNGYATKEEAEADGEVFVKKAQMLEIDEVKDNSERDTDEKPYMKDTVWSAYTMGDGGSSGWIQIEESDGNKHVTEVLDITDNQGKFYYQILSTKSVEQEEDAIRGETNHIVKNLFKYRKFYLYDGSTGRAEAIEADRDMILGYVEEYIGTLRGESVIDLLNDYGRYAYREALAWYTIEATVDSRDQAEMWLEWQLDILYGTNDATDQFKLDDFCQKYEDKLPNSRYVLTKNFGTTEYDPRDKDLIGTVSITKTSLDAFAILENVNTLDADYQYRDFKELIVELDYFDKEDLSDNIARVFTWLVPTYQNVWPILKVDKQNVDYGTLIHSQESIDFLIKVYEKLVEEEKALDGVEDTTGTGGTNPTTTETEGLDKVFYIGDSWMEALKSGGITKSSSDYFVAKTGASASDSIFSNLSVKSDASAIVVMLGLNDPTSQESMKSLIDSLSSSNSGKTIYVLKVFHVGSGYPNADSMNQKIDTYNSDISAHCGTKTNVKFIDATSGLIDGSGYLSDTYKSGEYHLTTEGYKKFFENISSLIASGLNNGEPQSESEAVLQLLTEAQGYAAEDAVLSPVTGKIIEFGTHERTNVYTEEIEKVGYVKIEVMGYGERAEGDYFTQDMLNGIDLGGESSEDMTKGLNSFYEEYEANDCGGYILMIDGLDIEELKGGFSSLTGEEYDKLCTYTKNEVHALYNSKEEKKREDIEELKAKAPSFINYNGNYTESNGKYTCNDIDLYGYYVKEGAYLGKAQEATERDASIVDPNKTQTQPVTDNTSDYVESALVDIRKLYAEFLEDKNPNYIRMIFLNRELTVIDNIEDYFPSFFDEGSGKTGLYGDLEAIDENSTFEEKIIAAMSYFVDQGFTAEAAAGIVGNMISESSLDPTADNGKGYHGLCQWNTNYGWWQNVCDWTASQGYNMYDFAGQVRATWEMKDGLSDSQWTELQGLTDIEKAAELFCVYYEACVGGTDEPVWYKTGYKYQGLIRRKENAKKAYDVYMGTTSTFGG